MLGPLSYGILQSGAAEAALWTPASPTTDGGVSPHTWQVPGVANYQDAAKTTPADEIGDVVGAVTNQGSDTHDITQATTARKPTLQEVTINSVTSKVWRHDGTDDWLRGAFGGGAISQPFTVFAVAQLDAAVVNNDFAYILTDGDDSTNRVHIFKWDIPDPNQWTINSGVVLVSGVAADSNPNIFTGLFNGASSQLWKNGVSLVSGDIGTGAPDGLTVGSRFDGGLGWWKGDIGPILIYASDLSTADKNQVGEYLERVTGITWTTIT